MVFLSVPNMQRLICVLETHFSEHLGIDIRELQVPLKQFLHKVMKGVEEEYSTTHTVHEMNKLSAKIAKDFLMQVAKNRRDAELTKSLSPVYDPGAIPVCEITRDVVVDKAESGADLSEKILKYKEEREKEALRITGDALPPVVNSKFPDPVDVSIGNPYKNYSDAIDSAIEKDGTPWRVLNPNTFHLIDPAGPSQLNSSSSGLEMIIPRSTKKRLVDKYLIINSIDRNFDIYKNKFHFQANLNQNDSVISNVRSITATRLIVPKEIHETATVTNIPNTNYNNKFGLSHQYLILQIDEFQNVYKSPSLSSSKAFAHFIHDMSTKSPSGRNYITLNPVMRETLRFDTNLYTQLSSLTLSVRQPNGELLNMSQDDYRIFKVDYDATNSKYLNIRLNKYFSKNEFFVGDIVRFTDFHARYYVGPNPEDYFYPNGGDDLEQFINRERGHEIVEIIDATASGYYSSFYIQAPGNFDSGTGLFNVRYDLIDGDPMRTPQSVLYQINDNINFPVSLAAPDALLFGLGRCINTSLQLSIAFKVQVEEDDVTV